MIALQDNERVCTGCGEPFDAHDRRRTDAFKEVRRINTPDGVRTFVRDTTVTGTIPNDCCSNCGIHKDRPVRNHRNRNIGGKRGRNSGTVGTAGKKR